MAVLLFELGVRMQDLEDQLIQKYENILLKAQKYKMPERELTIFDTALRNHHENPTTELLSFFLDPNEKHHLGTAFYDGFIQAIKSHDEYADFDFGQLLEIRTQQTTDKGNRIDLWFQTDTALVVIEVKVFHHQNNPFKDYVSWGNKQLKKLISQKQRSEESPTEIKLIPIVLCPDGKCDESDWLGVSFTRLTSSTRTYLAPKFIDNPFNKWSIFSRDFLLHLDSFIELLDTNMESLNFVVDHMQQIQELVELRENVYQEIINHINNELQIALGEEYEPFVRRHTWDGTPALRFIGNNWKDWSDSVLNLHVATHPMSCAVHMYVQHPTPDIVKKVEQVLKKGIHSTYESWYEGKKDEYWAASWQFKQFELKEVTQLIVRNHKILNHVELEWK